MPGDSFEKELPVITESNLKNYYNTTTNPAVPWTPVKLVFLKKKKSKAARGYEFHRVKAGDTMYSISQQYGVRLKNLCRFNYLSADSPLTKEKRSICVNKPIYCKDKEKYMAPSKKKNFFSQNTLFGLFVGLSFIAVAYAYYRSGRGVSLNPQLNNVILLLSIVGAFIGVRKYRDELPDNCLSYGKALGACTYLIAVASVIYGCFVFYLYRHHPELLENYLTSIETTFKEVYSDSAFTENMISMLKAFTTPATIAFAETFNKIFTGFIFSLLLAGLLRRTRKNEFI